MLYSSRTHFACKLGIVMIREIFSPFNSMRYGLNILPDYGLGLLSYAEIGSRDPSPSLCNVKSSAQYNVVIGFGIPFRFCL